MNAVRTSLALLACSAAPAAGHHSRAGFLNEALALQGEVVSFRWVNGETLTVDFTIEDPEYLKEPYNGSELWRYAPQLKLVPNKCDVEVARRYLSD